jgi:hypothetical protein
MFTAQAAAGAEPALPLTKAVGIYVELDETAPYANMHVVVVVVVRQSAED